MPRVTIDFNEESLDDGFRWCDVIETLGAAAHFIKRDCVEEGSVYKVIEGKWVSEITVFDRPGAEKRVRATWTIESSVP